MGHGSLIGDWACHSGVPHPRRLSSDAPAGLRPSSERSEMTVRMRFRTAGVGVALLAVPFVLTPQAQTSAAQHWVATWGTAQQAYRSAAPAGGGTPAPAPATPPPPAPAPTGPQRRFGIPTALPGLNNQSVRMIVR